MALLTVVVVALALTACSALPEPRGQRARPIDMFDAVVFGREYETVRTRYLAKWTGELRITLSGKEAARYRPLVARYALRLSELTGLPITLLEPSGNAPNLPAAGRGANVTITFLTLDEMETLAGPRIPYAGFRTDILLTSGCLFFYKRDKSHRITEGAIFVRTDAGATSRAIESCLLEEMTQVLGLPNDSDLISPSIFNSGDQLTRLSALDETLIRTLYHPSLSPGMRRDRALDKARSLLGQ